MNPFPSSLNPLIHQALHSLPRPSYIMTKKKGNSSISHFSPTTPPPLPLPFKTPPLPIRFLVSCPRPRPTKLLRLTPSVIRNEQCPIILNERLLELVLGILIHVFLVVCHNGFRDGLADGVDLRCVPAAVDSDANIDFGEFVETDDQEGFVDLLEIFVRD